VRTIALKPSEFRFGKSDLGVVVGFSSSIWNLAKSGLSFAESDVQSRWSAGVDQLGKLRAAYLTFWWKDPVDMTLTIPFDMTNSLHRELAEKITKECKLNFVNTEDLVSSCPREAHCGLWADVADPSLLEWLDWEERGMDIRNWKPSKPRPRFKLRFDGYSR